MKFLSDRIARIERQVAQRESDFLLIRRNLLFKLSRESYRFDVQFNFLTLRFHSYSQFLLRVKYVGICREVMRKSALVFRATPHLVSAKDCNFAAFVGKANSRRIYL